MKTIYSFGISLITLALFSCNAQQSGNNTQKQDSTATVATDTTHAAPMVGGDQDEHGCKSSAGYSWSVIRQECVRPFELETKFKDLNNSTLAGYALFSKDNKQVEIFAAEFKPTIVLSSTGTEIYGSTDQKYKMEKDAQKHWVISKTEDGKTAPILQQE
ncbi:hypothetical protein [Pedobacter gandavensis]|uniref:hypothetical protein n=1 Tax=Pedobacter gandavensis TaxID=2679963 RepID=UPI00292DF4C8|nr:hypothetical protein [Pedobacter gandavensis]